MNQLLICYWNANVTKLKYAYVTASELLWINEIRTSKGLVPASVVAQ